MWDERYSTEDYAYGTLPNDFLRSVAGQIPKGRVLTLAEGEGRNAVFLAEQGYEVVAVDASAVGLAKAQRLAAARGVHIETVIADLADFDIQAGEWNGIVSIFSHVPSTLRKILHRNVVAGLRPGGIFVLEAYTPAQLNYSTGGPKDADMMMTLSALREELHGLTFLHGCERGREVIEGRYHTGTGAVVQIVAAKP